MIKAPNNLVKHIHKTEVNNYNRVASLVKWKRVDFLKNNPGSALGPILRLGKKNLIFYCQYGLLLRLCVSTLPIKTTCTGRGHI